jgi:virginiamycin A acetyltransferase
LLGWAVAAEGGQMTSLTLRCILAQQYGIKVGNYSYGSLLDPGMCDSNTSVGHYVSIGPNVRRFGAAHPIDALSMHPYFYNPALGMAHKRDDVPRTALQIGDDAWIGASTIILPGCSRIGIGAVVGAGSIVTADVPDFAVVLGAPAKVVKTRLTEQERASVAGLDYASLNPGALAGELDRIRSTHGGTSNRFAE